MGLQPPTPEQRAQALANLAAAEAAQQSTPPAHPAPTAAAGPASLEAANLKSTLVGMAPDGSAPKAPPTASQPRAPHPGENKAAATTQVGFAPPAPVLPNSAAVPTQPALPPEALASAPVPVSLAPNVARALAAEPGAMQRLATSADAPTPIEVPIGNADSARGRSAGEDGKPTGVAKAYHPKSDNAPAVVVDEAALQAGQAAAQAEHAALAAKRRRNINAITIPGTVRVVPRGVGLTPDIEPIDMAAFKPSRKPLVIGVVLVLLGGAAAAGFLLRGAARPEPPPPAVQAEKPRAEAPPAVPIPSPETSSATTPAPTEAAPQSESASSQSPAAETSAPPSETSAKPAVTHRAPVPPAKPAPAKKAPAAAPTKPRATTQSATPTKGKGVIVRDSPF